MLEEVEQERLEEMEEEDKLKEVEQEEMKEEDKLKR